MAMLDSSNGTISDLKEELKEAQNEISDLKQYLDDAESEIAKLRRASEETDFQNEYVLQSGARLISRDWQRRKSGMEETKRISRSCYFQRERNGESFASKDDGKTIRI